ncbi:MAG: DUF1732 domain-containing protein [Candidatus Omnitrophica bacterium]|nr:DUF1732 domain-containing protein [Candidatus Omnitrophota bacterium]
MLKSMTGYGKKTLKDNFLGEIELEIKSSNHRYLEIVFDIPESFTYLEEFFRKEIKRKVKRGRLNLSLKVETFLLPDISLNKALLKKYYFIFQELRDSFPLKEELNLDTLLNLPGIIDIKNKYSFKKNSLIKRIFKDSLKIFLESRKKAGKFIYEDLNKRIKFLKENIKTIQKIKPKLLKEKLDLIEEEEEKINFLKNTDITEELNLLKFYIRNFESKLRLASSIGKELDFILQEMQREINTMGAKVFHPNLANQVLKMKVELEKMREEVQNVE